jgi:hypothetical protein
MHGTVDADQGRDTVLAAAIIRRLAGIRAVDDSGTAASRGLPLAQLQPKRSSTASYAISSIDVWGRLADRSALHALRWGPATRLGVSVSADVVVVLARPNGQQTLGAQGHLRLPASIRRACHIDAGDRLLLAALPGRDLLLVHTMPTLDLMLGGYYAPDTTAAHR